MARSETSTGPEARRLSALYGAQEAYTKAARYAARCHTARDAKSRANAAWWRLVCDHLRASYPGCDTAPPATAPQYPTT